MSHPTVFAVKKITGDLLGAGCFQADDKLLVVAVQGGADDWAAYADYETCAEAYIATNGLKVEQALAEHLFPDVALSYRR